MKKLLFFVALLPFILILTFSGAQPETADVMLTPEEEQWLLEHPVLYYAPDPVFAPYEFFEGDKFSGIMAEYLPILEDLLDVEIEVVQTDSWTETLEKAQREEIDFILGAQTRQRSEYLNFTDPVIFSPNIILVNKQEAPPITKDNLDQYEVGAIKGYAIVEYLELIYPGLGVKEYPTINEGLLDLSFGNLDAFVVDFGQGSYYSTNLNITNLQTSGELPYEYQLSLGVIKSKEELVPIFNKALSAITKLEREQIMARWSSLQYDPLLSRDDIRRALLVSGLVVLIALGVFLWNRTLKHQVNQKTREINLINANLEYTVAQRTAELEGLYEELKASHEQLQDTQARLIESEKYAALGELVTGVAHRLNTPIGNSITAMTYAKKQLTKLDTRHRHNQLSHRQMEEYIDDMTSATTLVLESLNEMATIVSRFKILEIAKISSQKEFFELGEAVKTAIEITREKLPLLAEKDIQINLSVANPITLFASKSWIQEIVSNMIQNAVMHGFSERNEGLVNITIDQPTDKQVRMVFEDNGNGIPTAVQDHVFEPFYSEKVDRANLGLGLSIVYNIVSRDLDGTITLDSAENQYTRFVIEFPID